MKRKFPCLIDSILSKPAGHFGKTSLGPLPGDKMCEGQRQVSRIIGRSWTSF